MEYQVKVTVAVTKKFKKRFPDAKDRNKILKSINQLKNNPRPPAFKKLKLPLGGYRVWAGRDIRVLYTIDDTERLVRVYKVDYRSSSTLYLLGI